MANGVTRRQFITQRWTHCQSTVNKLCKSFRKITNFSSPDWSRVPSSAARLRFDETLRYITGLMMLPSIHMYVSMSWHWRTQPPHTPPKPRKVHLKWATVKYCQIWKLCTFSRGNGLWRNISNTYISQTGYVISGTFRVSTIHMTRECLWIRHQVQVRTMCENVLPLGFPPLSVCLAGWLVVSCPRAAKVTFNRTTNFPISWLNDFLTLPRAGSAAYVCFWT